VPKTPARARIFLALFSVLIYAWLSRPAPPTISFPTLPNFPNLDFPEEATLAVIPGAEKHVFWASPTKAKSKVALLYLHGFSATRQEVSPLTENLAASWNANLFATRLAAHGLDPIRRQEAFKKVKAEDWIKDALQGMRVASELGDKLVIVAMSTGVPLALFLASSFPEQVHGLVLLSPNFGPADWRANIFYFPGGEALLKLLFGPTRTWQAQNPDQERYWTTSYDINAISQMMRLVDIQSDYLLSGVKCPTLVLYSEKDTVVSVAAIKKHFPLIGSTDKQLVNFEAANGHMLAGKILSPNTTDALQLEVEKFFKNKL
jgi:esterase/lipase